MFSWNDPLGYLKSVTSSIRRAFFALGIQTLGELLETLPRRYEDFSTIKLLFACNEGDQVTVRVRVKKASATGGFGKRTKLLRVLIEDASGSASVLFFNQPWLMKELVPAREVLISGVIHVHEQYGRQITKPSWRALGTEAEIKGEILPIYSTSRSIPQKTYRRVIAQALEAQPWPVEDPVPQGVLPAGLLPWSELFHAIHRPSQIEEAEKGRRRLAYHEVLLYRVAFGLTDQELTVQGGHAMPFLEIFARTFAESLPFPLTGDQKRAIWTALQDMEKPVPMRRLLQGDVGSGKTAVAAFLAAHTCRQGASTVFLAPTDILASQHAHTLRKLFLTHQIPLLLLTRTQKRAFLGTQEEELSKAEADARAKLGGLVLVGTHALLQEKRLPHDVGLVVVDEQHRFGVEQRQFLASAKRADGAFPHLLSMTATPIPRSLALTLFGDLATSSLQEKPFGRKQIASFVCYAQQKERAYTAIREAAARAEAAFVVCPLIDPSDALGVASVEELSRTLAAGPLAGLRLGMVHGRMKPDEKETAMRDLTEGRLDVLIATTVIEVGVDVPRATVMVIEGAERFGMAQLHQLRGRVGRSDLPSACYFLTDAEGAALDRLEQVARLHDGFALAEEDFRRRGGGNLFGTQQSGYLPFQALRWEDTDLFQEAAKNARLLLQNDPTLATAPWLLERASALRDTSHGE